MPDANYSALLVILDRSGSMQDIRPAMIEGLNALLRDQAEQPGLLTIDLLQFDDRLDFTHRFVSPEAIEVALEPRGGTALYDAIGYGLTDLGNRIERLPDHARPGRVEVVIVTDGFDNASVEFDPSLTRFAIQHHERRGWSFTFLGADLDAIEAGRDLGVDPRRSISLAGDRGSVMSALKSTSRLVRESRANRASGFTSDDRLNAKRS